jgi:uncharacterized membrane protein YdjX (TVP38/TMEM64 family)
MKKKTLKIIILIVIILVVAATSGRGLISGELSAERLIAFVDGLGIWGPLVFILIFAVTPTFLMPALPITIAGGVLFGPFWGVVYVSIGSTCGATLAFLIARVFGRKWAKKIIKNSHLKNLDKTVKKNGWKVVALTRIIPIFPYNLLNYAFGLTGIKLKTYILTSFIFMLPATIAYVTFSSSLPELIRGRVGWQFIAGAALIIILALLSVIYKRKKGDLT